MFLTDDEINKKSSIVQSYGMRYHCTRLYLELYLTVERNSVAVSSTRTRSSSHHQVYLFSFIFSFFKHIRSRSRREEHKVMGPFVFFEKSLCESLWLKKNHKLCRARQRTINEVLRCEISAFLSSPANFCKLHSKFFFRETYSPYRDFRVKTSLAPCRDDNFYLYIQ